jgi:hypothetical protein
VDWRPGLTVGCRFFWGRAGLQSPVARGRCSEPSAARAGSLKGWLWHDLVSRPLPGRW